MKAVLERVFCIGLLRMGMLVRQLLPRPEPGYRAWYYEGMMLTVLELLNYLLQTLTDPSEALTSEDFASFINYRNYTGNTPLHWAALNTHLDCVKALVEAGADISLKNDAGHDALFLAERADWAVVEEDDNENTENNHGEEEIEIELNTQQDGDKPAPAPTKARLVVEWLLSCDKGAGFEEPVNKQEDTKMEDAA